MNFKSYILKKFKDAKLNSGGTKCRIKCINKKCEDYWKNDKHSMAIIFKSEKFTCFRCGFSDRSYSNFVKYYEGVKLNLQNLDLSSKSLTDFKNIILKQLNIKPKIEKKIELPEGYEEAYKDKLAMNYLTKRKLDIETIKQYGIGYTNIGYYAYRVIFPSYENGKLIYFSARSIFPVEKKSLNADADKDNLLFGLDVYEKTEKDFIVIVEGAFDCVTVGDCAVALYGKHATVFQLNKLLSLNKNKYYVMLDGDARKQALELCEKLFSNGKEVYLVEMPEDNSDPNDMGREKCFERIKNNNIKITEQLIFEEKVKSLCKK